MKINSLIILLILASMGIQAQSDIRLNNYWRSPHFINPSTIYDRYLAVFNAVARKQWLGVPGSPSTFMFSGTTYVNPLHAQFGLIVSQDKAGYTSNTNIDAQYAYRIDLKNDWQVHLGLALDYQIVDYDLSKVVVDDSSDPQLILNLKKTSGFNSRFGFEFVRSDFKLGMSSKNIFSLFNTKNPFAPNTNFFYTKYRAQTRTNIDYSVGVCGIQYSNIFQAELNGTIYFKDPEMVGRTNQNDLFDIGLFYRTANEAGFIFGLDLSKTFHVSYCYDYHFGSLSTASYGTNELILTYNIQRKSKCHNCWY